MAEIQDLERYRGDTIPDLFTILNESGSAVDITDYEFIMKLDRRLNPPDDTTQVRLFDGVITTAASGEVEFQWDSNDANLPAGEYYYSVKSIDPDGFIATVSSGSYNILGVVHQFIDE